MRVYAGSIIPEGSMYCFMAFMRHTAFEAALGVTTVPTTEPADAPTVDAVAEGDRLAQAEKLGGNGKSASSARTRCGAGRRFDVGLVGVWHVVIPFMGTVERSRH